MPELPEVETIRNDLKQKILKKKIKKVDLRLKKIVKSPAKDFISILEGNNFKEIKKIYQAIRKILEKAVKYRGTTFYSYTDAHGQQGNFTKFLKVYKREKKECLRCKKGIIQKTKIAGRGTRYCDRCQK